MQVSGSPSALTHDDEFFDIALWLDTHLHGCDIRRTDLRHCDLLSQLPETYATLNEAIDALRVAGDQAITPELRQLFEALQARLSALFDVPIGQDLLSGLRPLFASESDVACMVMLMGWNDEEAVRVRLPRDVAHELGVPLEHLHALKRHIKEQCIARGFLCAKVEVMIRWAERAAPVDNLQVSRTMRGNGYAVTGWGVQRLLATADLIGVQTPLHRMSILGQEYLTRISDESYAERVATCARRHIQTKKEANLTEIAAEVTAEIGSLVTPRDARIIVNMLPGRTYIDEKTGTFTLDQGAQQTSRQRRGLQRMRTQRNSILRTHERDS